jgi:hypothetical protein
MKNSKEITRDDVIEEVYRSLRDALNDAKYVFREKNKIVFYKGDKKISLTLRIKIEDDPSPSWDGIMP